MSYDDFSYIRKIAYELHIWNGNFILYYSFIACACRSNYIFNIRKAVFLWNWEAYGQGMDKFLI